MLQWCRRGREELPHVRGQGLRLHGCRSPLLLLPSIFSNKRVFSKESALCIRWPKYWSFSISPSNEYSGLISFRIDCFDLLATQGTLKSLLQHHSSKASILPHSAFFTVQLSHPYMATVNMLSRLVITFLPRSKRLLISWLQSPSAMILEPPKIQSDAVSTVYPSICHEVMEKAQLERLSNRLILCHPLLLLPSIFPSIRVFCSKLALCITWPKYCTTPWTVAHWGLLFMGFPRK